MAHGQNVKHHVHMLIYVVRSKHHWQICLISCKAWNEAIWDRYVSYFTQTLYMFTFHSQDCLRNEISWYVCEYTSSVENMTGKYVWYHARNGMKQFEIDMFRISRKLHVCSLFPVKTANQKVKYRRIFVIWYHFWRIMQHNDVLIRSDKNDTDMTPINFVFHSDLTYVLCCQSWILVEKWTTAVYMEI